MSSLFVPKLLDGIKAGTVVTHNNNPIGVVVSASPDGNVIIQTENWKYEPEPFNPFIKHDYELDYYAKDRYLTTYLFTEITEIQKEIIEGEFVSSVKYLDIDGEL